MLTLQLPAIELFDEANSKFVKSPAVTLTLEHSLVSLSRWESKWEKPFLSDASKTSEETYSYISTMGVGGDIPQEHIDRLTQDQFEEINKYIEAKMTATWFKEEGGRRNYETITAEIIYYWMVALNIPPEYEDWHLNKLFTLIRVVNEKNKPPKKVSRQQQMAQQRSLNEQRRAQYASNG
jgi:hypothetical protein